MNCTHCGAALPDAARFCTGCGAEAPAAVTPPEPAPLPLGREPSYAAEATGAYLAHAHPLARLAANVVDMIAIFLAVIALVVILTVALSFVMSDPRDTVSVLANVVWFGLLWLYFALFESSPWGATPGKLLLGIRVVRDSGARLGFGRATARTAARLIPFDALVLLFNAQGKAIHDIAAGTVVVPRKQPPGFDPAAPAG